MQPKKVYKEEWKFYTDLTRLSLERHKDSLQLKQASNVCPKHFKPLLSRSSDKAFLEGMLVKLLAMDFLYGSMDVQKIFPETTITNEIVHMKNGEKYELDSSKLFKKNNPLDENTDYRFLESREFSRQRKFVKKVKRRYTKIENTLTNEHKQCWQKAIQSMEK